MLYLQYLTFYIFAVFVPAYTMVTTNSQYIGAYLIYIAYVVVSFVFELLLLFLMQLWIKDKSTFNITVWIVMKMVVGQLNRFSTFTSVAFIIYLMRNNNPNHLGTFAIIVLIATYFYPLFIVFWLIKLDKKAFNPYLEWNTKLSYITGLRGMSTAFDSLCLWNFHTLMGKSISIPKAYALQKTLITDLPQFTI